MLELLAEEYARLKGTKVLAKDNHGETITFVLESGQKLTMTAEELQAEIDQLTPARPVSEAFEYIEEAVRAEQPKKKGKTKK